MNRVCVYNKKRITIMYVIKKIYIYGGGLICKLSRAGDCELRGIVPRIRCRACRVIFRV